jgi:thioredoxin reductase (NADPH)
MDPENVSRMPEERDRDRLFPKLGDAEIARLARRAEKRPIRHGEVLWKVGAPRIDFYVILSGSIEIVQPRAGREESITVQGPREFTGDVDLIFGSRAVAEARVRDDGEVLALSREALLSFVQTDPELSDLILRTFLLRRAFLIAHGKGDAILVGSRHSADTLRLREFLSRNGRPYTYLDVESDEGVQDLLERFGLRPQDLPALIVRGELLLRNPTNLEVAEQFGFAGTIDDSKVHDLVIVGAGPAGLAAAVYAASEGLDVLALETNAPGGQAATSSRIENYLGFPAGIPGQLLAARAFTQANKFGAKFAVARTGAAFQCDERPYTIALEGGGAVKARTAIIASGVRYRPSGIPGVERFEGTGVYHAATHLEAQLCGGEEVAVVGGANSAGQAAVFLARSVRHVYLIARCADLAETMSRYLIRCIEELPNVTVRTRTRIVALEGGGPHLERVRWRNDATGDEETREIRHVFLMIGADPNTSWLANCVALDDKGFVKTGNDLSSEDLAAARWPLARPPYPLETTLPGVFAAGDVRAGSVKRISAAVGEGAGCVQLVHKVLQE